MLTASEVTDPNFWRKLCPQLSVEGSTSHKPPFDFEAIDPLLELLRVEGHVNVPDVVPVEETELLAAGIDRLHERDIPLVFAFVFDEFWGVFQRLSLFLEAVLGGQYRGMPEFWIWRVDGSESGWHPHRDRMASTFDADNTPHSLTVWLAISDATPLNGCIYVIPANLDGRLSLRTWDDDEYLKMTDLQNIRALPASRGAMLAWNQRVVHWGARASTHASRPRMSASFEFQRGDKPPLREPLIDVSPAVPFRDRLQLISSVLLRYEHWYPLTEHLRTLAETTHRSSTPGC